MKTKEVRAKSEVETHVAATAAVRSSQVQKVFDNTQRYLSRMQVDIRIRRETVREFASSVEWSRLLDIGCGDGSISIPLLTNESLATLMDLSPRMAAVAESAVPNELRANVTLRTEDFMSSGLGNGQFDLVICVGVLAHVSSPSEFISRIAAVLQPGGGLVLEFTDSLCPPGRIIHYCRSFKEILAPPQYRVNRLSASKVFQFCESHGLRLVSVFRYATVPIPGIGRLLGQGAMHRVVRAIYGDCSNSRCAQLGNNYICLLERK